MRVLGKYFTEYAFSLLAFAIFGMLFVMRPVTWVPTLIILICALWAICSSEIRQKLAIAWREDDLRYLAWPLFFWFLVSLFVGFWHLGFAAKAFPDNAFRMALVLTTFFLSVRIDSGKYFLWGLIVAGFCVALNVAYGFFVFDKFFPRISGTTNHPIHFGNFSMLLAVLLLSASLLIRKLGKPLRGLCILAALLACVGSMTSQSRSSIGVLLCLVPLVWMVKTDFFHKWAINCATIFIAITIALATVSPWMQEKLRFKEAVVDIEQVTVNNYHNSIGARLTMWHAAWLMFKENPALGIGPGNFESDYKRRVDNNEVQMGDVLHLQPHSDLLHAVSSGGILKLLAYLLLISGPMVFFYKKYRLNKLNLNNRAFPMMGMQVVGAFFVTGLTNSNFDLQIYSTVYAVLVCVLARLCIADISVAETSTPSVPVVQCH